MKKDPYHNGITDGSLVEDFDRETSFENLSPSYKLGYRDGYNKGISDGNINDGTFAQKVKEAYENGLNDAWEAARKLTKERTLKEWDMLIDIFGLGRCDLHRLITKRSASEAIEMIKKYEDKMEIKVGDEVIAPGYHRPVVVIAEEATQVKVMNYLADSSWKAKDEVTKTMEHYDEVENLFKKMRDRP